MKKLGFLALALICIQVSAGDKKDLIPKVYGKIMVSYGLEDVNNAEAWELNSHASRVGVKGKYKLNDSLKAVYQLEWEVDVVDKSKTSEDHIKSRNQFVGLAGNFGTVLFGRHDTPTKKAQGKVDLFNDLDGDIKNIVAGEVRASNVMAYKSPKLGEHFGVMLAAIPGETPDADDGPADYFSANMTFSKNGFYGAIAADSDVGGKDVKRLVAMYKNKKFHFGGLYELAELTSGGDDHDAFMIGAAYKASKVQLKVQFGTSDIGPKGKGLGSESYRGVEQLSFGIDYSLHKQGGLFAYYSTSEDDGGHESSFVKMGGVFKF